MMTMNTNTLHPHPFISLLPLAVLIALIALVLRIFPDDALSGASQVALMVASSVCVALSMLVYKTKWTVFEEMIKKTVGDAGVSILILLLIGMMSATWMVSGVVPTMIYYGVQLMSPWLFLPCACIISSFISVITGTSWTTIATIGIALMGIGDALGIPQPYTAGAIISGAYFGDKMSPMSDTTVLASSMAGADLFSHIRYMLYTTVPSIVISLVLYLVIGLFYNGQEVEVNQYLTGLNNGFNISLWTMVVPLFTALLIYKKMPSLITLLLSSLAACLCAVVLQPEALMHIAGEKQVNALSLFEGLMLTCYTKTNIDTGFEAINSLVATRGMVGMLSTVWLILCAMCFGSFVHGGERHVEEHYTHHTERHQGHGLAGVLHCGIGRVAQPCDGRPVPVYHHERVYLSRRVCRTWLPSRVAQPFHRGLGHGDFRIGALDSLRHDAEHGVGHSHTGVSAFLFLQYYQPHHELPGCSLGICA